MHWIGIGFLIAIGFALACVILPLLGVVLVLAWEFKKPIISILIFVFVVLFGIALVSNPEFGEAVLGWGLIALIAYSIFGRLKMPKKKTRATILLVEDEKPLSHAMTIKLTNAGYDVTHTDNGEDALRLATEKTFDLILLGIIMPKMDGLNMLALLQKSGKLASQKVIMFTSIDQQKTIEQAMALGASGYIVKRKHSIAEMIEKINETLRDGTTLMLC
jgi:CheY-like chemotaxis protein